MRECAYPGCHNTPYVDAPPFCPMHLGLIPDDIREVLDKRWTRASEQCREQSYLVAEAEAVRHLQKKLDPQPPAPRLRQGYLLAGRITHIAHRREVTALVDALYLLYPAAYINLHNVGEINFVLYFLIKTMTLADKESFIRAVYDRFHQAVHIPAIELELSDWPIPASFKVESPLPLATAAEERTVMIEDPQGGHDGS